MVIDLLSLPQELHIRILSHLDAISLTHCAMTCQSMYRTLQTTSQLLYILQLHFAGLTDAGTTIAHAELIERIRRHRQAWLSPNHTGKREYVAIDMQYQCLASELVGGVFANTDGQHFEVVSLPTSSNEESRTPRAAEPGMRIRDFTMDPTQDVIAYLEDEGDTNPPVPASPRAPRIVRVHIRTLSTNKFHPRAQQSFLQVSIPSRSDRFSNRIHTACLYFARDTFVLYLCTFDQERPYVQIWDWKTAEVILDCSVPFDRAISERRFEFVLLDSTHCFITDPLGAGSIRLYAFVRPPAEAAARAPVHLATLHLPPTADDSVQVRKISSDASPLTAHPRPDAPFVLNGDDRLHVFTLQYGYPGGLSGVLNLFVHQRVFTRYCTPRAGDGGGPREVPWEAWGPVHTRLVYPAKILRHLLMYVDGQRAVWMRPSMDAVERRPPRPPNTIEILDFSLAAVSSAKGVSPIPPLLENGKRSRLVGPSMLVAGRMGIGFFKDDVETHLPCVSMEWELQREYALYMIYEDGIIGVDRQGDDTRILHVYSV